jgi:hypothetical protein
VPLEPPAPVAADSPGGVDFHGPSFAASPLTDAVVLAWRKDLDGFDDRAWIIPTIEIPRLAATDRYSFRLPLRISATKPSPFDPYRVERTLIPTMLESRVAPEARA